MDLYRLNFHKKTDNTMVVGVDVHNMGTRTIMGMTASYSKDKTQYFSRVAYQSLGKELIKKGDITKED